MPFESKYNNIFCGGKGLCYMYFFMMWWYLCPCIPKGQVNAADQYSALNLQICEADFLFPHCSQHQVLCSSNRQQTDIYIVHSDWYYCLEQPNQSPVFFSEVSVLSFKRIPVHPTEVSLMNSTAQLSFSRHTRNFNYFSHLLGFCLLLIPSFKFSNPHRCQVFR